MFLLLVIALGRLGGAAVTGAAAQSAADAAALAALHGGEPAARRLALVNGAVLVSCTCDGDPVEVVVEIDGSRAVARASRVP